MQNKERKNSCLQKIPRADVLTVLGIFVELFNKIKFKIVNVDGIAVLCALFLQHGNDAGLLQYARKERQGLIIIRVDLSHEIVQPFALDIVYVVLTPDGGNAFAARQDAVLGRIFRLVHGQRRQ